MNIAALATASGAGAIAIVRLSGPGASVIASNLNNAPLKPRFAHLLPLKTSGGELIDEAIVIYFKAPNSFTGEDVVEFQLHGGISVANIVLDELIKAGARLAMPGEFSKRAFLNGKMSLDKAESTAALINARSQNAAKILARTMSGELQSFTDDARAKLLKISAYIETAIDYADDDLPPNILDEAKDMLNSVATELNKIAQISNSKKGLIDGFKIAIIGRPNVGKSSILNALLAAPRAIVSDIAGTTRDTIEEQILIGSHLVRIVDTAGIRQSGDGDIENIGIEYSKKAANEADIILLVLDSSNELTSEDKEILEFIKPLNKKLFFVLNKSDLPKKIDLSGDGVIKISAKNGEITALINELKNHLDSEDCGELMLSSDRQIIAANAAAKAIKRSLALLNESEIELFSYELNEALNNIGEITQKVQNSELLDEIFSHFCLGK